MDISQCRCPGCDQAMKITTTHCEPCNVKLNGEFEVSTLARLPLEDQLFVMAFLRHHGSIKKMEELFGISYPTVKNKLNFIVARLDKSFDVPSPNSIILDQLAAGEITVDEALKRMG
jgi:hypothetical protein